MLFYEYKITLPNNVMSVNPHQGLFSAVMSKIKSDVDIANSKLPRGAKFFISNFKAKTLSLAAAVGVNTKEDPAEMASVFAKLLGYVVESVKGGEITIQDFANLIHKGEDNGFIKDTDDVLCRLGLESYRKCSYPGFNENLVEKHVSKDSIDDWASGCACSEELRAEIDRIYDGEKKEFSAHPVHYIIYCDDLETEITAVGCLVSALHSRGRLRSRRYDVLHSKPLSDFFDVQSPPTLDMDCVDYIYRSIPGGAAVLKPENLATPGNVVFQGMTCVDELADVIRNHRHDCLTILLFSKKDMMAATKLKQELSCMRFIEIKESPMSVDNSIEYLMAKARKMGFGNPASLVDVIDHEANGYYVEELNQAYEKWLDKTLCDEVYPQYSEVVHPEDVKSYNKGDAYDNLKQLIGLNKAKSIVDRAIKYNSFQKLFKDKGHPDLKISRHMVFSGNPGTAKTTVARLFAQIMKDNGILPVGKLVEVGRTELVGKYVGWTAKQVANVFKEARGSVLFIDEAYSLCEQDGLYGDEAINTIVQYMENQREDTIVIFAGYPDKMQQFLDKNPGLRSRIAFHVNFDDYDSDDLFGILNLMANQSGMILDSDVRPKFNEIASKAMKSKDFGNGRFVRNVFEQAIMSQATRVMDKSFATIDDADLTVLKAVDFRMPEELELHPTYHAIGFAS